MRVQDSGCQRPESGDEVSGDGKVVGIGGQRYVANFNAMAA